MAILASDGSGQPEDVTGLRSPGYQFEARSGKMVAFIDNELSVITYNVGDFALSHQALDQRDIDAATRLPSPARNRPNVLFRNRKKCSESLHPLREQFLSVNQNQGITGPLCDERCGDDGLPKRGRRRENAVFVARERIQRTELFGPQCPEEACRKRGARLPVIFELRFDAVRSQQFKRLVEATPRQRNVARVEYRTGDDARFPIGRQPHRLRPVILRVLESSNAHQERYHSGREIRAVDIDLISQHDAHRRRERVEDRG